MRDRSIASVDSQRTVAYIGIPGQRAYRYCRETDPSSGVVLDPRTDIANLGTTGGDTGYEGVSLEQLAIAILADFFEDTARVARLYTVFAQRIRNLVPAGRCWIITEIEVSSAIEAAELDNKLTWDETKGRYQDEPEEDIVAHKTFRQPTKEQAAKSAA
jgi:hypothetical protein